MFHMCVCVCVCGERERERETNHSLLCQGTPSVKYQFNPKIKVTDKYTF